MFKGAGMGGFVKGTGLAVGARICCIVPGANDMASWDSSIDGMSSVKQTVEDGVWQTVRAEASIMAAEDRSGLDELAAGLLPRFIHTSILQWDSLEEALAWILAVKLHTEVCPADMWKSLLAKVFCKGTSHTGELLASVIRTDLRVIKERDPACPGLAHATLNFKGFQGLQVYRAGAVLWRDGKHALASMLQSRMSEVFGMDIHPGAKIGKGVLIDHATGIVIGETAVVGDGCTLLHSVTLGGTGKDTGDRHPKLGSHVFIGAGASILGKVKIGDGAKIGAAALVLTDIPAHATAVGSPAKVVGVAKEDDPAALMDGSCKNVTAFPLRRNFSCPFRHLRSLSKGYTGLNEFARRLEERNICVPPTDVYAIFNELDVDQDGHLSAEELAEGLRRAEKVSQGLQRKDGEFLAPPMVNPVAQTTS
eukprot:TRINITY_DN12736_c0_g1_i1.p1 TRINITY_DN12736_c0_g1~~TRINITY_DN12736_c0_g1_i1.p1  ORF type:complete len:422 (+),score=79.08 TRINITY_DN12736_c0_g1_i1:124-1389(+)